MEEGHTGCEGAEEEGIDIFPCMSRRTLEGITTA